MCIQWVAVSVRSGAVRMFHTAATLTNARAWSGRAFVPSASNGPVATSARVRCLVALVTFGGMANATRVGAGRRIAPGASYCGAMGSRATRRPTRPRLRRRFRAGGLRRRSSVRASAVEFRPIMDLLRRYLRAGACSYPWPLYRNS